MQAIRDFLAMGGYAIHVWSAYATAAVVMLVLLVSTLRRLKAREAELDAMDPARRREGRRG